MPSSLADRTPVLLPSSWGGSLALVALLLVVEKHVERRLETRVEEAQAEVLAEVDRVSSEVRDLDARFFPCRRTCGCQATRWDGQLLAILSGSLGT